MAIRYKVEFTPDDCLRTHQVEREEQAVLGSFWGYFDRLNNPIDFTEEFLAHISNGIGVEIVKAELMQRSGSQNTHFSLHDRNGKKYFMRMGGDGLLGEPDGRILGEFTLLKKLEGLCSASFSVHFADDTKRFTDYPYFVGEFIEGTTIPPGSPWTEEEVTRSAKLLKEIHSADIDTLKERGVSEGSWLYGPPEEPVPESWIGDFMSEATKQKIREACKDIIPLIPLARIGLTHHDFHRGNMMETASGYRVVDWEFGSVAHQAVDIGCYLCQHYFGLTAEHAKLFLSEYGYGQTEEEMSIVWYFWLKRVVLSAWFFHTQMSKEAGKPYYQSCIDMIEETVLTRRIPGF